MNLLINYDILFLYLPKTCLILINVRKQFCAIDATATRSELTIGVVPVFGDCGTLYIADEVSGLNTMWTGKFLKLL